MESKNEVKNEGLEVAGQLEVVVLYMPPGKGWNDIEPLCLHSEALAGYAVRDAETETWKARAHTEAMLVVERDARIAELERALKSWRDTESGLIYQLRAELAALKVAPAPAVVMSDKLCVCGLSNATVGSVVLHTDHLAAMAAASARSGELAELLRDALRGLENVGLQDSYINYEDVGETMKRINVFLACAKARAKAGGE